MQDETGQSASPVDTTPKLKVRHLSVDKLVPYERNPRINDHAVDQMASIIRRWGWRVPMLVRQRDDGDVEIVDGHLRWKAARTLGIKTVPVHDVTGLSEEEVRALRLSMNKAADLADWDEDLLSKEVGGLIAEDFDMDGVGFSGDEIDEMVKEFRKDVESEFLDDAISGGGDAGAVGVPKQQDGDAGDPADPHYVQVTFTMSEASRSQVLSYLKDYARKKGYSTTSAALVGLLNAVAPSEGAYS